MMRQAQRRHLERLALGVHPREPLEDLLHAIPVARRIEQSQQPLQRLLVARRELQQLAQARCGLIRRDVALKLRAGQLTQHPIIQLIALTQRLGQRVIRFDHARSGLTLQLREHRRHLLHDQRLRIIAL